MGCGIKKMYEDMEDQQAAADAEDDAAIAAALATLTVRQRDRLRDRHIEAYRERCSKLAALRAERRWLDEHPEKP